MSGERLLLVGAGHTHLHLIAHAPRLREVGYEVVLAAPRWFHYSGTASAVAGGDLAPERGRVDVAALARRAGVAHHLGRLVALDPRERTAGMADGTRIDWDVASFNVGSVVDPGGLELDASVLRAKPLEELAHLGSRLEPHDDGHPVAVTVVGGGSSGVEIAAHVAARFKAGSVPGRVRLVHAGPHLAPGLPPGARRRLGAVLARSGVTVHLGVGAREIRADHVRLQDGTRLGHDVAVLAGGLMAVPLVTRTGLGDERGIPVRASLRHRDHDNLYAVGDCAHFLPGPLPRIGVHGVRQAPVLLDALLARARGEAAPSYVPQSVALSILDLGAGRGLAVRGRWWWEGRAALRLKRLIDRRWLMQYQI